MATMKEMMDTLKGVSREVEAHKARRAPDANKLTKVMGRGAAMTSQRYYAGTNLSGEDVYFHVADHVNVAGYHLTWQQTQGYTKNGQWKLSRTTWAAFKTHTAAINTAKRRAEKFRQRVAAKRAARVKP